jgi:lipopolysaccharide export system permease protein
LPTRILFITSTRLGDAVLSTGVLARLLADHKDAEVTIVCGVLPAPIFRAVPGLKRLIPVEKRRFAQHWIKVFLEVFATRWDVFFDMRNVGIMHFIRARKAYRYRRAGEEIHKVEEVARLIGAPPIAPRLWIDARARAEATVLLGPARGFLALGPTAGNPHKEWALERFAELAQRLTAPGGALPGAAIAVFASAKEAARLPRFLAALPADRRIDLSGRTDPLSAAACLERAALYVGNDSGLMHIAAATGIPTLGLFGTGTPAVYRPWGERAAFIDRRLADPERFALERSADPAQLAKVMSLLTVDEVEAAVLRLLRRAS